MGKDWRIPPSDHRGNDTALTVSRDNGRLLSPGREPACLPPSRAPRTPPGYGELTSWSAPSSAAA
jgi:hypothetical protein